MSLLPLFLKLEGRRVVVVGDGAQTKVQALREAGADVMLIQRAFLDSDLDEAWLVLAASTPEVNRRVAAAAEARRIFCNAVDDPQSASAYMGGVVRRGGATVAVSTDGHAPALAGLLREALEAVLPEELERWLDVAKAARAKWKAEGVEMKRRRPLLLEALNETYR